MWTWTGKERPPWAEEPQKGQESVWDYPRPPRIERDPRRVVVRAGQALLADTMAAVRVLETASPPTFYIPPNDVPIELLTPANAPTYCEWKGEARHWSLDLEGERSGVLVAWSYPSPTPAFESIRDYLSFYPGRVECLVAGERVQPQDGGFYGGWITSEIVGPFKGAPGTGGW